MKKIGPHFENELQSAGLLGLPFSWGPDGKIMFSEQMSQSQIDAVIDVYSSHDPDRLIEPITKPEFTGEGIP